MDIYRRDFKNVQEFIEKHCPICGAPKSDFDTICYDCYQKYIKGNRQKYKEIFYDDDGEIDYGQTLINFMAYRKTKEYKTPDCTDEEIKQTALNLAKRKLNNHQYIKRKHLLNDNEQELYKILLEIFSKDYYIFPQIAFTQIAEKYKYNKNETAYELNKVIDFGLFDKKTFTPKLLIELNGQDHRLEENKISRDNQIIDICLEIDIPILFIENYELNDEQELIESLNQCMEDLKN